MGGAVSQPEREAAALRVENSEELPVAERVPALVPEELKVGEGVLEELRHAPAVSDGEPVADTEAEFEKDAEGLAGGVGVWLPEKVSTALADDVGVAQDEDVADEEELEESVESALWDPARDRVALAEGDALLLPQLECDADAHAERVRGAVAVERAEAEGPLDRDGALEMVAEAEAQTLRLDIGERETEEQVEAVSVALCVVEEEDEWQVAGDTEGERDTEEQRDTVPLGEKVGGTLRDGNPEGEVEAQTVVDSNTPLTVGVTEEEKQSVGEPEVDGVAEAQIVFVALEDIEPLTLRDIVPVGLKEGEVGALRVSVPVGDKEAV